MTFVKVNNPIAKSFDGLMNELFNEFPANFGKAVRQEVFSHPPVNIYEKPAGYQLEVSAPGLEKADFSIKIEDKLLTISAEQKARPADETEKAIRSEFSSKAFKRSFTLDEKIDATGITAKYENGILLVHLPKKAVTAPATTAISVQ
jgi:HSP20 family protein